ncbi:MAG: bifunctional glutamate N-acetyltransferase/amino-acid acetyltransferase ArgJ [Clostridia bacterium]|nr:bifunctional glutamate N-acetyltransferase/amino-acid acetyltransferase ArgJ [Clostridia bacterium]
MEIKINDINGGITSPKGFSASGIHCGLRKNKSKSDLALIFADRDCTAAGVYTTNKVFAAPVGVTRAHLSNGHARAIICNSGNANTCNSDGYDKANATCASLASALNVDENDIVVASTGVIGVPLPVDAIINGIPALVSSLDDSDKASSDAATAIMTTDTKKKEYAVEYTVNGETIHVGGICKGSGMIEPNMATMLGFITTDASISPELLDRALHKTVADTFNMVSVDGDTSTNDMVIVLASGAASNTYIDSECDEYFAFEAALDDLCHKMCRAIAADGEGATKLLECTVSNFSDVKGAKALAKSVIKSSLVKAAMFGADANWGRILCALGYAGIEFDTDKVDVCFRSKAGSILVCKDGRGVDFSEELAKEILTKKYIYIDVDLKSGDCSATAWGCDLSYEYVRINGDYRS